MCFEGIRPGANDYQLCAVPTGSHNRHELQARRWPSGHKINPWPVVPPAQFAAKIRSPTISTGGEASTAQAGYLSRW